MKIHRITADFSLEAYDCLCEIAKRLNTSKADALRRTLGFILFVVRERKKGRRLIIESQCGCIRREVIV